MKKHTLDTMISEAEIQQRVADLGSEISAHYRHSNKELVLVGLLKGSFILWPTCAVKLMFHMKSIL